MKNFLVLALLDRPPLILCEAPPFLQYFTNQNCAAKLYMLGYIRMYEIWFSYHEQILGGWGVEECGTSTSRCLHIRDFNVTGRLNIWVHGIINGCLPFTGNILKLANRSK